MGNGFSLAGTEWIQKALSSVRKNEEVHPTQECAEGLRSNCWPQVDLDYPDPGGVTAISPGSRSAPGVKETKDKPTPEGSQHGSAPTSGAIDLPTRAAWDAATPPGSIVSPRAPFPGCAARPGANGFDPSGVGALLGNPLLRVSLRDSELMASTPRGTNLHFREICVCARLRRRNQQGDRGPTHQRGPRWRTGKHPQGFASGGRLI